jgi:hypothetical protein
MVAMVKAAKADFLKAIAGADGYVPDDDVTGSTGVARDAQDVSKRRPRSWWRPLRAAAQHTSRSKSVHPGAY